MNHIPIFHHIFLPFLLHDFFKPLHSFLALFDQIFGMNHISRRKQFFKISMDHSRGLRSLLIFFNRPRSHLILAHRVKIDKFKEVLATSENLIKLGFRLIGLILNRLFIVD